MQVKVMIFCSKIKSNSANHFYKITIIYNIVAKGLSG